MGIPMLDRLRRNQIEGLICNYASNKVKIVNYHDANAHEVQFLSCPKPNALVAPASLSVRPGERENAFSVSHTGRIVFLFRPMPEDYSSIDEIAHQLARINRYAGAYEGRESYSVAQHSVNVALLCPPHLALNGLLHDTSEIHLSDIIAPFKHHLADYQAVEELHEEAIATTWRLAPDPDHEVKKADRNLLYWEAMAIKPALLEYLPKPDFTLGNLVGRHWLHDQIAWGKIGFW